LAYLNISIPQDARAFSISLNAVKVSAESASQRPVKLASEAGKIHSLGAG